MISTKQAVAWAMVVWLWLPLSALGEPKDDSPFEFTLSHPHPHAGDRVFYRLAWVNRSDKPVRVPAIVLDKLKQQTNYRSFSHYMARPQAGANIVHRAPTPVSAKTVKWVKLDTDEALERHGELNDLFEQCKGGCKAGRYRLKLSLAPLNISGTAADQVVDTSFGTEVEFEVLPPRIPVTHAPGLKLTAKVKGKPGPKGLILQATIVNQWRYPIWFAKHEYLFEEWDLRIIKGGKESSGEMRMGAGGQGRWDTKDAVLIQPGGQTSFTIQLKDFELPKADQVYMRLRLRQISEFQPSGAVTAPHWFSGPLISEEIRLR